MRLMSGIMEPYYSQYLTFGYGSARTMGGRGTVNRSQSASLELMGPLWNTAFPITLHASAHICAQLALLAKIQMMFYEIQHLNVFVWDVC